MFDKLDFYRRDNVVSAKQASSVNIARILGHQELELVPVPQRQGDSFGSARFGVSAFHFFFA